MNTATAQQLFSHVQSFNVFGKKQQFREKFQRSLRCCVNRGFSVEESFGMIWVETWEEISLSEQEQAELYDELIDWAKNNLFDRFAPVIHNNYSQDFRSSSAKPR